MKKIALLIVLFYISFSSFSQIIEVNKTGEAESSLNLEELIKEVLISGDCAEVDSFNSQQNGSASQNTTKSYGFFKKGVNSNFPFEEGIILTSGQAYPSGNTASNQLIDFNNGLNGDADLEENLNINNTQDATFVKFNFTPLNNKISFRFLMASEEYDGSTECSFADGFAFLLKEVGATNYINLAVLPDAAQTPVNVTNINDSNSCRSNVDFFEGYNLGDTNYGGRTKVLIASANVTPNTNYEIKLVIADQGDSQWDSAVFLEAGSFNLGADLGVDELISTNNAVCGATKLLEAVIDGDSYKWFKDNVEIPGENNKTYLANLGDGVYKVEISLSSNNCATTTGEIQLDFITPPTATQPTDINHCDADRDGFHSFDLQADKNSEILNGQDPAIFEVVYFDSMNNANQNTPGTALANPYTNPTAFSSQTIYARVHK